MRIGEFLYFSPKVRFSELNFDDASGLIEALMDRVDGFYLLPASRSLDHGDGFAGGLVCCAAIEFIALVSGSDSPVVWLSTNIAGFATSQDITNRFWNFSETGCLMRGVLRRLVKDQGKFRLELDLMLTADGSILIVNPRLLLSAVSSAFHSYCARLDHHRTVQLVKCLRRYFEPEAKAEKS